MKKTYKTPRVKVDIMNRSILLLAGSVRGTKVYDDDYYYEESDGDIL